MSQILGKAVTFSEPGTGGDFKEQSDDTGRGPCRGVSTKHKELGSASPGRGRACPHFQKQPSGKRKSSLAALPGERWTGISSLRLILPLTALEDSMFLTKS